MTDFRNMGTESNILKYKTAREWFNTLPEPYKSQALYNADIQGYNLKKTYLTLEEALTHNLNFTKTLEGYDYWHKFLKELFKKVNKF